MSSDNKSLNPCPVNCNAPPPTQHFVIGKARLSEVVLCQGKNSERLGEDGYLEALGLKLVNPEGIGNRLLFGTKEESAVNDPPSHKGGTGKRV